MKLDDADRANVEDRRGRTGFGRPGVKLGLGGTIVLLALSALFGQDFLSMVGGEGGGAPMAPEEVERRAAGESDLERVAIASFNDAQGLWQEKLDSYRPARLVLFWDGTRSGCGDASSAMGPFYCPVDERVYIDLGFYRELARRFGAPGDLAQAYVIAHEVGHHLQNVLGIAGEVREAQERDPRSRNALSVRMELQADCLAGIWARSARERRLLEPGDLEEALGAAAAVGDDRIQRKMGGAVDPDSFTHGSAADRARWFRKGFDRGALDACDTFGGT